MPGREPAIGPPLLVCLNTLPPGVSRKEVVKPEPHLRQLQVVEDDQPSQSQP